MPKAWKSDTMTDKTGYLTPSQVIEIVQQCENERDWLLITLLFRTGRRVSEVLDLKPNMILQDKQALVLPILKKRTKGDPPTGIVYLDYKIFCKLIEYIEKARIPPDGYVFQSPIRDNHINRHRVYQIVRRLGEKAGIYYVGTKRLHPHHFRHSFAIEASNTLQNPADLRALQELMGHSSIAITEFYLKFDERKAKSLVSRMWKDK